jgi:hypothetical protein
MRTLPYAPLAWLLVAFAMTAPGCTGKNKTSSADPNAGPAPAAVRIELSQPEASLATRNVSGANVLVFDWKVKYRFVEGKPDPAAWYTCVVDTGAGVSLLQKQGKDMNAEGVLEQAGNLVLKEPPKTLKIVAHQGVSAGQTGPAVSNELTCEVKPLR